MNGESYHIGLERDVRESIKRYLLLETSCRCKPCVYPNCMRYTKERRGIWTC